MVKDDSETLVLNLPGRTSLKIIVIRLYVNKYKNK